MKIAVLAAMLFCATMFQAPQAKADTLREVAIHVCEELAHEPTVDRLQNIVISLFAAGNTLKQENEIMAAAIQVLCPEYKYLTDALEKEILRRPARKI